jgi:hypothetical protein
MSVSLKFDAFADGTCLSYKNIFSAHQRAKAIKKANPFVFYCSFLTFSSCALVVYVGKQDAAQKKPTMKNVIRETQRKIIKV